MNNLRLSLALAFLTPLFAAGCDPPLPVALSGQPPIPSEAGVDDAPAVVARPVLINLGRLRPSAGKSRRLEARAVSSDTVITGARTDDGRFEVSTAGAHGPRAEAVFNVRFAGTRKVGPLVASVLIDYRTAPGDEGTVAVPVVGAVAGDLRIPRGVYLHKRGGRFAPRKVVLTRRSGKPVHIRSIEDPDGLLVVTLLEPRSKAASFLLEVRDLHGRYDGSGSHPLLLTIDDAAQPDLVIEYRIDSRDR